MGWNEMKWRSSWASLAPDCGAGEGVPWAVKKRRNQIKRNGGVGCAETTSALHCSRRRAKERKKEKEKERERERGVGGVVFFFFPSTSDDWYADEWHRFITSQSNESIELVSTSCCRQCCTFFLRFFPLLCDNKRPALATTVITMAHKMTMTLSKLIALLLAATRRLQLQKCRQIQYDSRSLNEFSRFFTIFHDFSRFFTILWPELFE